MENKIKEIGLFIFLTILSGLLTTAIAIEPNMQILGQLTQNNFEKTSEIEKLFKSKIKTNDSISYKKVPRGLIISVESNIFFKDGSDELKKEALPFLNTFGDVIKILDKPCVIEGNSFSSIFESPYYNSNWELSIVQAEKIVQYLIKNKQIDPQKIRAVGFGEIQPKKNDTLVSKFNQRIDFVILNYEKTKT